MPCLVFINNGGNVMLYEDGDIIILSVVTPSMTRPTDGGRVECRVRYKTTHLIHLIHQVADSLTLKWTKQTRSVTGI